LVRKRIGGELPLAMLSRPVERLKLDEFFVEIDVGP
jgi:hypothetical protein